MEGGEARGEPPAAAEGGRGDDGQRAKRAVPAFAVTIVVVNALTGLSISLVLKLTDNVVKGFSLAAAVILAAVVSTLCCGYQPSNAFGVGTLIVGCAFFLFFTRANERIERDAAREDAESTDVA